MHLYNSRWFSKLIKKIIKIKRETTLKLRIPLLYYYSGLLYSLIISRFECVNGIPILLFQLYVIVYQVYDELFIIWNKRLKIEDVKIQPVTLNMICKKINKNYPHLLH